jgi:predicted NBD/HSP70 family sugar kinase
MIRENGRAGSEGSGRPSDLLAINPQAGYAIGLDIDAGRQIAVMVNLIGEVVSVIDEPPPPQGTRQEITANLESLVARMLSQAGFPRQKVFGLGLGLRRTVDPVTGVAHGWPSVPGWEAAWTDFPVRQVLQTETNFPHVIVDDVVRALGVAEANYGAGSLNEDFVYLLADTGIGMAIMLNGAPYIGFSHIAGEIGHLPVPGQDDPCPCGSTGCLENHVSTGAILSQLRKRFDASPMRSSVRLNDQTPTIREVLIGAAEGDKLAYQLIVESGEKLGQVLAMVVNLIGPRLIIAGGALATSEVFLDAARRIVKFRSLEMAARVNVIQRSTLDDLAGARGAATMVLNALFMPGEHHLLHL